MNIYCTPSLLLTDFVGEFQSTSDLVIKGEFNAQVDVADHFSPALSWKSLTCNRSSLSLHKTKAWMS